MDAKLAIVLMGKILDLIQGSGANEREARSALAAALCFPRWIYGQEDAQVYLWRKK